MSKLFDEKDLPSVEEVRNAIAPKKGALRYNDGKPQLSMIPYGILRETSKVLMFGSCKYSRNNWKKGMNYTSVCDSALRHIRQFVEGQNNDQESNLSHLAHAVANLSFLMYYIDNNMDQFDDR